MLIRGKISADQLGFSVPTGSPPYLESATRHYVDLDILRLDYLSDASAVAKLLPDVLEIDDQPRAYLSFNRFGFSNAGCYLEVMQGIECYYKGKKSYFALRLYLNSDTPMLAGREWFGIPKLAGTVHFDPQQNASLLSGRLERPAGILLASGVMRPDEYLGPAPKTVRHNWGLRLLPPPTPEQPPIRELIGYSMEIEGGSVWSGVGTPHFTGASAIDPLEAAPVRETLRSTYFRGIRMSMQATGEVIDLTKGS
jgi:acetoacetate decarboxylase